MSDAEFTSGRRTVLDGNRDMSEEMAGRMVHHAPGYGPENHASEILDRTREKIAELGWVADSELGGGRRPTRRSCRSLAQGARLAWRTGNLRRGG